MRSGSRTNEIHYAQMLMTYRYLTVNEVAKALQYYEEKTGMQYWYKDSAGEGDEEDEEEGGADGEAEGEEAEEDEDEDDDDREWTEET